MLTPRLMFGAQTIGIARAASFTAWRSSGVSPVVPSTNACRVATACARLAGTAAWNVKSMMASEGAASLNVPMGTPRLPRPASVPAS